MKIEFIIILSGLGIYLCIAALIIITSYWQNRRDFSANQAIDIKELAAKNAKKIIKKEARGSKIDRYMFIVLQWGIFSEYERQLKDTFFENEYGYFDRKELLSPENLYKYWLAKQIWELGYETLLYPERKKKTRLSKREK